MRAGIPVSYTHLDVYKRQVQGPPHLNPLPPGERKEKKMGEGQDEGENLGCRSKLGALR